MNLYELENLLFSYFENLKAQLNTKPLYLGGVSGPGGGSGGPVGGFIGLLPQSRVAFDDTEEKSLILPASGATLLQNLNRIRYWIDVYSKFTGLKDTPSSYSGHAGKALVVKQDEEGIEFVTISGIGGSTYFTDLLDTPSTYSGYGGKYLRVKATENGLEFSAVTGSGISNGVTLWLPDAEPSSPSNYDDEFNDNTFNGWTVYDNDSYLSVSEEDYGLVLNGNSISTERVVGIYKDIFETDPYVIFTSLALFNKSNDNLKAGIALFEDPTNYSKQIYVQFINSIGNEHYLETCLFSGWDDTSYQIIVENASLGKIGNGGYLKLVYDAGNVYNLFSIDGYSWADYTNYSSSINFIPTGIGLVMRKTYTDNIAKALFKFFRVVMNGDFSTQLHGRRVNI